MACRARDLSRVVVQDRHCVCSIVSVTHNSDPIFMKTHIQSYIFNGNLKHRFKILHLNSQSTRGPQLTLWESLLRLELCYTKTSSCIMPAKHICVNSQCLQGSPPLCCWFYDWPLRLASYIFTLDFLCSLCKQSITSNTALQAIHQEMVWNFTSYHIAVGKRLWTSDLHCI